MIEIGVLIFGILTGNIMMAIGFILLKAYNFIPTGFDTISALAFMLLVIARKIITAGGSK